MIARSRSLPSCRLTGKGRSRESQKACCETQELICYRYNLAEDLNKQLDDLSRNLSQMIEEVNKLSTPAPSAPAANGQVSPSAAEAASQMPDDPINQLSAILGAHLRALGSIDSNAGKLEGKVAELEGRMGPGGQRRLPRR
jgi:nuclear pore complex protein Nup62